MTVATGLEAPLLSAKEISELLKAGSLFSLNRSAHRTLHVGRSGETPGQRHGSGLDFAETQRFGAGDNVRQINWRASARSRELQVQRFHQDIAPSICIVVDLRSRMRFGTRRRLKAAQAARLAVVLAATHAKAGAEVAALLLDIRPHWVPPAAGMAGAIRLAQTLGRTCLKPEAQINDVPLVNYLEQVLGRIQAGSRLHLISDFADLRDDDIRSLRRFNTLYEVTGWRILDPAEQRLNTTAGFLLCWPGNGEPVDTRAVGTDWIDERLAEHTVQIGELLSRAGINNALLSTELDDIAEQLGGILL